MTTDELRDLTIKQSEYARDRLDDFIAKGTSVGDDGYDAIMGALDLASNMIAYHLDSDTDGFMRYAPEIFNNHSVDGVCPEVYPIADTAWKD